MEKIPYSKYFELLTQTPDIDSDAFDKQTEEIKKYSKVVKGVGGFDFELRPDPEKVDLSAELEELESALKVFNNFSRWRRKSQFHRRLNSGEQRPVLVSEGDSWFQFPVLINDVVDQLNRDYIIYSVGAAGDTAQNMVHGPVARGGREYMTALGQVRDRVEGFLFSAAGNDIIGEDPETGTPVLYDLIRPFNGNTTDVEGHIDQITLREKLTFLKNAYRKVIMDIRAHPDFKTLPIIIHGYDYAFPYPFGDDDPRDPSYADNNGWLGDPLDRRGIADQALRRKIIIYLVDALYDMLEGLSGNPHNTHVWLVNCRKAMPSVTDWNDEIHGNSDGFKKVAVRFKATIQEALLTAATVRSSSSAPTAVASQGA